MKNTLKLHFFPCPVRTSTHHDKIEWIFFQPWEYTTKWRLMSQTYTLQNVERILNRFLKLLKCLEWLCTAKKKKKKVKFNRSGFYDIFYGRFNVPLNILLSICWYTLVHLSPKLTERYSGILPTPATTAWNAELAQKQ